MDRRRVSVLWGQVKSWGGRASAAVWSKSQTLRTGVQKAACALLALAAANPRRVFYGMALGIVIVTGLLALQGTVPISWLAGIAAVGVSAVRASAPRTARRG